MKKGIIFVVGAAIGGVAGFFIGKYVEKKKHMEKLEPVAVEENDVPEEYRRVVEHPELVYDKPPLSDLTRDYETELAEAEFPRDDDPDDITEEELAGYDEEQTLLQNFDHEATKFDNCRIISREEAENLPERFSEVELMYFVYDDVIMDEDDEEMNATVREQMVPRYVLDTDHFTDAGYRKGQAPENLLVLNPKYDKVFNVQRVMGSFDEFKKSSDWEPDE